MIAYYVHHHGSGHLHRALTIAARANITVLGLSSLPAPAGWAGPWIRLPAAGVVEFAPSRGVLRSRQ